MGLTMTLFFPKGQRVFFTGGGGLRAFWLQTYVKLLRLLLLVIL
jgi:hypothetical protein